MVAYSSNFHWASAARHRVAEPAGLTGAVLRCRPRLGAGLLFLFVACFKTSARTAEPRRRRRVTASRRASRTSRLRPARGERPAGGAAFIAEVHALLGGYVRWGGWVVLLGVAMLVGAAWALRVVGRLCLPGPGRALADLTRTESAAAGLLAACIVGLGIWPAPLIDLVGGSVGQVARLFGG
jgi:NADH-quinone oxidoreductase subunit M